MMNLMNNLTDASSVETFRCGNCSRDFEAKIITWIDVSRAPHVKRALLTWDFNIIQCTHCGCRHFSGTPFFFEDFEAGLLIAVFPRIPEERGNMERVIRGKYGYYPALEFFYDMTQLWVLLYFQEHYKTNKDPRVLSKMGGGEERLRKMLHFLKEDPLMIDIREKLTESFFGDEATEELADILRQAVYMLEEMLPWPLDRQCRCGADLATGLTCCGSRVNLDTHDPLLSRHYVLYCPTCKEALWSATCGACGRAYTWKLGLVGSYADCVTHNGAAAVQRDRKLE
jgi:CpXC protein